MNRWKFSMKALLHLKPSTYLNHCDVYIYMYILYSITNLTNICVIKLNINCMVANFGLTVYIDGPIHGAFRHGVTSSCVSVYIYIYVYCSIVIVTLCSHSCVSGKRASVRSWRYGRPENSSSDFLRVGSFLLK